MTDAKTQLSVKDSRYVFKTNSQLRNYILDKRTFWPDTFTLRELMFAVSEIIKEEKCYDVNNWHVLILNADLENVLGIKYLHSSQIK